MEDRSQEDFQKLILEVIKKQGEKIEKFINETKKTESSQVDVPPANTLREEKKDFFYACNVSISARNLLSKEEIERVSKVVGKEIGLIMDKYKISKLTAYTAKIYD